MKLRSKLSLIILFFLTCIPGFAQNIGSHHKHTYDVKDGLNSNYVKGVAQDNTGRLWIVTDAGVMSFDGNDFTEYTEAFAGVYLKDIIKSSAGVLYLTSDDGLFEIQPGYTGVKFKKIIAGELKVNENALCFPKQIFEDRYGNIWIGDLTGLVRFDGKFSRKFSFNKAYWPDSYFRSYSFLSAKSGRDFAASNNGAFFYFDRNKQEFTLLQPRSQQPFKTIDAVLETSSGLIVLGTDAGLVLAEPDIHNSSVSYRLIWNENSVSSIAENTPGRLILGSWAGGLYLGSINKETGFKSEEIFPSASVKRVVGISGSNIWAATDRGIILLQEREISAYPAVTLPVPNVVVTAGNGVLASTDAHSVKIYDTTSYESKTIYNSPVTEIREIVADKSSLWIVLRNFELIRYNYTASKVLLSMKTPDDRVHSSFLSSSGQFWGYLPQRSRVVTVDIDNKYRYTEIPQNLVTYINVFTEYEGEILAGGYGGASPILKYDKQSGAFVPSEYLRILPDTLTKSLRVNHLVVKNGLLYVTTPQTIIIINRAGKSYRILNKFPQIGLLRCTYPISENLFAIGSDGGVYVVDNEHILLLQESDGLKSASVLPNGLFQRGNNELIAATTEGFSVIDLNRVKLRFTPAPKFVTIDQFSKNQLEQTEAVSGVTMSFKVVSYIYPGKAIKYYYRISGQDTVWKLANENGVIHLIDMSAGDYRLQVQGVAAGYFPSEYSEYSFTVKPKWYSNIFVVILFWVSVTLGIRYAVQYVVKYRTIMLENKRKELEQIIQNRTLALAEEKERTERLLLISEKANRELEQLSEQKSLLMSVAAHDLKNPLQSILGFAELISDEVKDDEIKQSANFINTAAKKMLTQIQTLLESMSAHSSNHPVELSRFKIAEVVQDVLALLGHRASVKKQSIINEIDATVELFGDIDLIAHMFDNLISNAVKYSPFGATIKVSCKAVDDSIIVQVSDEGPGFTEEDLEKAFRRFQRLSAKPTGGESSTGLGLSIVKSIVDRHKGTVSIANNADKGATFTIVLPRQKKQ